ncbi:MAG: phosphotransferase [Candidatus Bathyarchaeota archaeon]|nr:phosphotransferase [Candidatus Bathyarchaeota archaeon]
METGAEIYRLTHNIKPNLYLKLCNGPAQRLFKEYAVLRWINSRVPVPHPIHYMHVDGLEYQLTTEVQGTPIYQVPEENRESAVRYMARTLRRIHSLPQKGCPYLRTIDVRHNKLGNSVESEKQEQLNLLKSRKPDSENLVFTHGDFCLSNVILNGDDRGGVIDWDYAGLADPYVDLVSAYWSQEYNYGKDKTEEKWFPLFLCEYGVTELDEN